MSTFPKRYWFQTGREHPDGTPLWGSREPTETDKLERSVKRAAAEAKAEP